MNRWIDETMNRWIDETIKVFNQKYCNKNELRHKVQSMHWPLAVNVKFSANFAWTRLLLHRIECRSPGKIVQIKCLISLSHFFNSGKTVYQRKIEALGGRLLETVSETCHCLLGNPETIIQSPKYLVKRVLSFPSQLTLFAFFFSTRCQSTFLSYKWPGSMSAGSTFTFPRLHPTIN